MLATLPIFTENLFTEINPENSKLEEPVFKWIMEQRENEISVSISNVVNYTVSLDPNFNNGRNQ